MIKTGKPDQRHAHTLQRLRSHLMILAPADGDFLTALPALSVHRRSSTTQPIPCIYDLGLAITVSGKKRVTAGQDVFEYEAGEALLASADLPVVSRVTEASPAEPYLGMMLHLDPRLILQIATGLDLPRITRSVPGTALTRGSIEPELLDAIDRLVSLLDEPRLLATVSPLVIQEIIARVLISPFGPPFMALNASSSSGHQITRTMAWLKQHFAESVSIDTLAEQVHMSPSTFRQHFKSVAGMSPLQYLKNLRLQEARQLMLNEGLDAGASGLQVGYESVSQFSREYARLFGAPPVKDIRQLRAAQ